MNIKFILLGLAALAGTSLVLYSMNKSDSDAGLSVEAITRFYVFKAQFGKEYSSPAEMAYRQKIFANTLQRIEKHNSDSTKSYRLGINKFSDLTAEERKAKYLITFPKVNGDAKCEKSAPSRASLSDDKEVDWLKAGKVQAVKDQGQCGSCWAFATAGALESAYAIYKKVKVPSISEQELVSCSSEYGNMGCNGGLMSYAYDYILDHKINSEAKYPYSATDEPCNQKKSGKGQYTIKGCVQVDSNVKGLIASLRAQPVAVAFYVQDDFFDYHDGVYDPTGCDEHPNHGVLAIGFKLNAKIPYFQVKNSWGEGWGDKGFFKISIGKDSGTCDIAGSGWNYYPTVK